MKVAGHIGEEEEVAVVEAIMVVVVVAAAAAAVGVTMAAAMEVREVILSRAWTFSLW